MRQLQAWALVLQYCYVLSILGSATSTCALLQTSLKVLSTSFTVSSDGAAVSPMHTLQGRRSPSLGITLQWMRCTPLYLHFVVPLLICLGFTCCQSSQDAPAGQHHSARHWHN